MLLICHRFALAVAVAVLLAGCAGAGSAGETTRFTAGSEIVTRTYGADFLATVEATADAVMAAGFNIERHEDGGDRVVLHCSENVARAGNVGTGATPHALQVSSLQVVIERAGEAGATVQIIMPSRHVTTSTADSDDRRPAPRIFSQLEERLPRG